jgi:hypothetical protein
MDFRFAEADHNAMSTETPPQQFAILGQRKLHTQAEIVHARGHNNREEEVGNAVPDATKPIVILGPADAWQGVTQRLHDLGIKPRKGAVLAIELMMTASPGWFIKDEDGQWSELQLKAYERLAMRYIRERFVPEAIISVTWHLDEQTPHLHVIASAVRRRVDQRFGDKVERWTLCARGDLIPKMAKDERADWYASAWRGGIGGRGHMAFEQTRFAEIMAPLKLERGKVWSGAPNKPNAVWQAEMATATSAAKIERDGLERDRAAVAVEADRQRGDAAKLKRLREALDAERAGWDASIAAREAALAAERTRLDEAWKAMDERGRKATKWKREADARDAAQNARAERLAASSDRLDERDEALSELVPVVTRAVAMIDPETLPPAARTKFFAVARELGVSIERAGKANPRMAGVAASRRTWEGYRVGG